MTELGQTQFGILEIDIHIITVGGGAEVLTIALLGGGWVFG